MIDEYHKVSVNRISPEFPMPIMWSNEHRPVLKPGGVTNVVSQFKYFNIEPELVCFADQGMRTVLRSHLLPIKDLVSLEGRRGFVPVKRRFLDGQTQVVRWDVEDSQYGVSLDDLYELQNQARDAIKKLSPDVVIFSDYNKGFFTGDQNWIDLCSNAITIVDPKTTPLSRWRGCTVFKPNFKEAKDISGYSDWRDQAKFFKEKVQCGHVFITMGGDGVVGISGDEFFHYAPDRQVRVESVVGAGDCFVAGIAMAIAHGFDSTTAASIAYEFGAQYVQHGLNRPITPAEMSRDKIVDPQDLKNRDFKLVFTNGCFDIVHSGHLQTLEYAKTMGDKLVVALNSDASIKRLKGDDRPIKSLDERMGLMAALECVDFVVSFDEDTPYEVLRKIMPDALVKGAQYELTNIVGADFVPEVYRAPMVEGKSTTQLLS